MLRGKWIPGATLREKLAAIGKANAASPERWAGMPPLAAEGPVVDRAEYNWKFGNDIVGEERLVVGTVDGKRVIVAQQVLDIPVPRKMRYRIDVTSSSLDVESRMSKLAMVAHRG